MSDGGAPGELEVVLVRHAETEWSVAGRHTGSSDVALTDAGRAHAAALPARLTRWRFAAVLVSPLRRARETCELAGLGRAAEVEADLREWDYGDYEGLSTAQIDAERPGWSLWRDGCPGGESAADVGARADRVLAALCERSARLAGPVAVFSHGHMLRVLGARWIGLEPGDGARLALSTAAICVLAHERETAVLSGWNLLE